MTKKNLHAPTIVKKTFRALQQADPTFILKPFDRTNKSNNGDISNPSDIPNEENGFEKYVQGVSVTRGNKLRFSMRVTNTITFKDLRAILDDYETESGTKHNYDRMVTKEVFAAGYLQFVHPKWINRDHLVKWILEQADIDDIGEKIHIYPRRFYNNDKINADTHTEIVVIDGALEHKKEIMNFLYGIEWSGKYQMINFIPWNTSKEFTKTDQIEAIRSHNSYMSTLTSEILKIKNPGTVLSMDGENNFTFIEWLENKTLDNSTLFYSVEKIGAVEVLISYPESNTDTN